MQVMERNTSRDNAMEVSEFLNLKRKVKVRIQKPSQLIFVSGLVSWNRHGMVEKHDKSVYMSVT